MKYKQALFFAVISAAILTGLVIIIAAFFLGDRHAVESMHFTSADPTTLARAMRDDHFYSDYQQSTLLMTGTVDHVDATKVGTTVGFMTNIPYAARCSLDSSSRIPALHEPVRVLAEGGTADRQPDGVLLTHCIVL